MQKLDLEYVDDLVQGIGCDPDAVVPILQAIQHRYRYLPEEALHRVCELTDITPASIAGVSTFYTHFRHRPIGKHLVSVCVGTACHVKGASLVEDAFHYQLGIPAGQDTDPTGKFTVQQVACLGCCTLGPVVQIDDATYGHLTPQTVPRVLHEFERDRHVRRRVMHRPRTQRASKDVPELRIGLGSCCQAQGADNVHAALVRALDASGRDGVIKQVGCTGMCHQAPLVELAEPGGPTKYFTKLQPETARLLVQEHFKPRGIVRPIRNAVSRLLDHLYSDELGDPVEKHALDVRDEQVCAFLGPQRHLATEKIQHIDPLDLDEYTQQGGFRALQQCLDQSDPNSIIDQLREAGLRGRGGAGFPTHIKWSAVRAASEATKYVFCNGDEGDPGAFMDRVILESIPMRVIEGMAIAALAVGAQHGIFYVRAEYPLAVMRVREALRICRQRGYLGQSVMGSSFSLDLEIKEGAGAFICGEETAMIQSIEGHRGIPRLRPPYPAEKGFRDAPTLINNVETYALVPWIMRHGAQAFAELGTETSKGTKVFALAGKILRGGLIEVPMGVTIREIVEQIGGGVVSGREFKAVQIGGPSGGCVPARLADTPIDYESLASVGAIMGSGGLVVMDDSDCMVDIARYFLRFTQNESCGKCTYCRVGTKRLLDILDRVCCGQGRKGDLEQLEELSTMIGAASICGLGKTAPNPVLSTLKYFRGEYEEHLHGRCPAGKCLELIAYGIDQKCIGCTLCAQHCPVDAIPLTPYQRHTIDMSLCVRCDSCRQVCPEDAVFVESKGS